MTDLAASPLPAELPEGDLPVSLRELYLYPVKSCRGQKSNSALVLETGFEFDRFWVLVDPEGVHITQRTEPRLVLVTTQFRHGQLVLRAPGMLTLHIELDQVAAETPTLVKVWRDEISAYDMGPLAQQWFSDYLGRPVRLMRFDPDFKRVCDRTWTGELEGQAAFADGFSMLVVSQASIDHLNERLAATGAAPVSVERFRPNLVLDGLEPHQEDELDELRFATPQGLVRLKIVKPCTRCPMPNVNLETGEFDAQPGLMLATYRGDPRMGGAVTFGMNAIVVEGVECLLQAGMAGNATYKF